VRHKVTELGRLLGMLRSANYLHDPGEGIFQIGVGRCMDVSLTLHGICPLRFPGNRENEDLRLRPKPPTRANAALVPNDLSNPPKTPRGNELVRKRIPNFGPSSPDPEECPVSMGKVRNREGFQIGKTHGLIVPGSRPSDRIIGVRPGRVNVHRPVLADPVF
jgi:hypothetical protein